ncbi:MAG: type II toxin-antitoxin system RelE/ParE family toxin [Candidatus Magasanikbacteria bacterium]|nr:type II toxin-antitoxin system RelE/ParE family toxin [Candidatus Magasanikbacteria bacterium]
MLFTIEVSRSAENDLALLDQQMAQRIADKLHWFISQANPLYFAVRLRGTTKLYRFRIGDYRAIFEINKEGIITILLILRIKHRREVYRF